MVMKLDRPNDEIRTFVKNNFHMEACGLEQTTD